MRTLTTVMMTGFALISLAGCSSHQMMDKPMEKEMTSMEKPMAATEATSTGMMKEKMAGDTMEKPMAEARTMQ